MKEVNRSDIQFSSLASGVSEYPIRIGELILKRFQIKSILGSGSFGKVLLAYDTVKQTNIALKVLHNNKGVAKMAKEELKVLKKIQKINSDKKNPFISLLKYFRYNSYVFMVFPLLHINLYELIARSGVRGVSLRVIRGITEQLLDGLSKLREIGIIHCDLKPENIMLVNDTTCQIKIIDFGSATSVYNKITYTYIQSRFYRAPEILLQLNYKCSIDMWSLAVILVELHCGVPLFEGENEHDQLVRIVNLLGMPPLEMIWTSPMIFRYFETSTDKSSFILISTKLTKCIPNSDRLEMFFEKQRQLRHNSPEHTPKKYAIFVDFLQKILSIDPKKRIHPSLAKSHPFIDAKNITINLDSNHMESVIDTMSHLDITKNITSSDCKSDFETSVNYITESTKDEVDIYDSTKNKPILKYASYDNTISSVKTKTPPNGVTHSSPKPHCIDKAYSNNITKCKVEDTKEQLVKNNFENNNISKSCEMVDKNVSRTSKLSFKYVCPVDRNFNSYKCTND